MAFDQNSIPKDLRPLNIVRTVPEDSGIAPVTTSGRPVEVFYGNPTRDVGRSPGTIPGFYYPTTVTDAGFVGQGFTNAGPVAAGWVPQVVPSQPLGVVSVGPIGVMNSGAGSSQNLHSGARVGSNPSDQASDDGGDNSVSGRKVKFLCSFGGRIIPRPSDGALRYVGGQTRIISLRRDVSFAELVRKMVDTYGQDVAIKYQLPDEDLDALVSVSSPEDLENMMDEYEKLVERVSDGSAKLRVFLFSASDLESSGVVQLGYLQDSGQRYVEAVNGTNDGVSGIRLTRKASIASAGSTQNSEISGSEAVDSLGHGQGELRSVPSFDALSPSGTSSATSQEPAYRLVSTDANPATHADASVAPMTNPLIVPGPVPSLSAQPEHGLEKTVPVTGQQRQMGYDMQQTGTTYPGTTPYVPAYVDLQRETLNRADYVQIPSQMGFPRQLLGTVGPVINQQHIIAGAPNQQFLPALHMTMTPSGHVSMNPNLGPSLIQPQPVRLEHYPAEGTLGQRVVRFPVDQGYGAYQHHAPPALGGAYAWHQIPHTQQVPLSEGQVPQPLVTGSEASPRFDDCLMCQKSLPHAHSDTIAQEQRESPASTVSDFNPVYHSLRLDERGQPIYRAITTGTLGEVDVEQKGASVGQRIRGQMDHGVGKGQGEVIRVSQTVDKQYECDRNLQKPEVAEHPKVSVPQGMIGLTGTMQSPYGVFVGAVPQPCHVNVTEQLLVPSQYQVKQEVAANKPVNSDCLKVGGMPGQTPDNFSGESPKNYGGAAPMMLPKENDIESVTAYNHLRQIEGRMENLLMHPTEIIANNEQSKPAVDNFRREDILNNRVQQFGGREGYLGLVTSNVNPNEMPVSSNETPFLHNIQAAEGYEFSQHPVVTNPGVHVQSNYGVNHLIPDEISPHLTALPAHATERTPAIGEWKDGAQHFQPMLSPTTAEMALHDGTAPSEQDNSNSLYSNQDPWNLQHDTHFPPPKPSKLQLKREAAGTKDYSGENRFGNSSELPTVTNGGLQTQIRLEDGTYLPSGNTDFSSDQLRSKKGSEEEMIKQELQAVAEGVAACVLQSSTPSNADLSIHGRSESPSSSQRNAEFESTNARKEEPKDKFEETITKFPERANLGFPVSDGIGRLQIIKNGDLEEIRELGSGTFGTVYHGKWRGSDVAIKRINDRCFAGKASEQERMRDDFWNEAIKLADLHHPNVVAFYGVVLDGPGGSVATVTEYMVNGSLRNALQKNERNLDKRKRLVIAMDVAFGMEYLHGKNIVHFDLKSDNLLVNLRDPHRPICKVGDLGLSKVKCQTLISGGVRGTLPWMAPELLNGSSSLVSEKVDVFSYGIVMWELLTREEPYAELHYGAIIGGIVSNTLRPPVPVSCDPDWRSLMERCWSAEPSERPNFTEIANELRVMQSKIPPKGQNQQSPPSANTTQAKS